MKKNRAFTLVELMAVIIIISLIALLTFPNIINQIKKTKKINNDNINTIVIEGAKKYVNDNKDEFNGYDYCIPISDLVENNYIKEDVVNIKGYNMSNKVVYFVSDDNSKNEIVNINDCETHLVDDSGNLYEQVEYLESTGTQYINTNYYCTNTTKAEMDIQMKNIEKDQKFFGSYGGGGVCLGTLGSKWRFGSGTWHNNEGEVTLDKTNIVIEKNTFKFNEKIYKLAGTNAISNNNSYPILVFGVAYNSSVFQKDSIRLFDLKLYDNNIIMRDYMPVIDSKGKPCLFDKVEKKCYYNQGTGEFLYG